MAKGIYIGVSGKARKVKRLYVGVGSKARKVKKMYIGVGGKARLCYSAELEKVGTATALRVARYALSSARVSGHVLFAGGAVEDESYVMKRYVPSSVVDAYNASLTRSSPTNLSASRAYMGAASVGGYALFAGGITNGPTALAPQIPSSVVDAYNASLTRTSATKLATSGSINEVGLVGVVGGSIGNHAIFAGGAQPNSDGDYGETAYCSVYDASLTRTSNIKLSTARYCALSASVGDHVLFAGGHVGYSSDIYGYTNTSGTTTVEAFDSSLTLTHVETLSDKAFGSQGVSFKGYALFPTWKGVVNAYNSSLTRTTLSTLKFSRNYSGATAVGDYAIFAGGYDYSNSTSTNAVEAFDASLTKTEAAKLSDPPMFCTGISIEDHALFAGGTDSDTGPIDTVDVYTA